MSMSPTDWREWGNFILDICEVESVWRTRRFTTMFAGPWGTHPGTAYECSLYAYFIAEYIETDGND